MQRTSAPSVRRGALGTWLSTSPRRLILGVGALLVIAALAVPAIAFVRTMSPSGQPVANESQLGQAQVGDPIKAVVRLDRRSGNSGFSATFLQPLGSNGYQVTSRQIRIDLAPDLSVTMGSHNSLQPGAVVRVSGQIRSADTIAVDQATVLTGFVTVSS